MARKMQPNKQFIEPKINAQAQDFQVEEMLNENIHHTNQGNVWHYYVDIHGQCDELEDENTKGLIDMQASTSLDETQLNMHNSFNDPISTQDQKFAVLNTIRSSRFKSTSQPSNK